MFKSLATYLQGLVRRNLYKCLTTFLKYHISVHKKNSILDLSTLPISLQSFHLKNRPRRIVIHCLQTIYIMLWAGKEKASVAWAFYSC